MMSLFEGKHALIIEDDALSVDVLNSLLARLSMTSTAIDSYGDVVATVKNLPALDVIFLDLEMPGNNGYEVLAILQEKSVSEQVPVVAYTTHLSHVHQAREAGFHSFLGKPLKRDEFPVYMDSILKGESVWVLP